MIGIHAKIPDLGQAEKVIREGLTLVGEKNDEKHEASLTHLLASVLLFKGDLDGALSDDQRALKITENVYGPDHPEVAIYANNVGQILQDKGDMDGAHSNEQRAH